MDATQSLPRASDRAADTPSRPRMSSGLQRYLAGAVFLVSAFVLLLLEFGYALLVAVVVARRWDLDFLLVLPVLWRTALSMLNDSIPIALLFGSGLVYGRFVADREISAMKSFGLSFRQLLRPLFAIGGGAALVAVVVVGFLCPEMNYAKGDVSSLLAAQLRYLGEGWSRTFPFGNYNVSVWHYEGRVLHGVVLRPQAHRETRTILPEDVSRSRTGSILIYARRATVLFPEELEGDEPPPDIAPAVRGLELPEYPPGTIVFLLDNVLVFFANELIDPGEPSRFMQSARLSRLPIAYDPAALNEIHRQPKQLLLHDLVAEVRKARAEVPEGAPVDDPQRQRAIGLETELWFRLARVASFFLYPVLAGLIALFLNAGNRYLAFFVSCLVVPSLFYGTATAGQVLAGGGFPPGPAMLAGTVLLGTLLATGVLLLDWRWLR